MMTNVVEAKHGLEDEQAAFRQARINSGVGCVERARKGRRVRSSNKQRKNRYVSKRREDGVEEALIIQKIQRATNKRGLSRRGCSSEIATDAGRSDSNGGA